MLGKFGSKGEFEKQIKIQREDRKAVEHIRALICFELSSVIFGSTTNRVYVRSVCIEP